MSRYPFGLIGFFMSSVAALPALAQSAPSERAAGTVSEVAEIVVVGGRQGLNRIPGSASVVDGEDLRLRVLDMEPLERALQRTQKGIRVFLADPQGARERGEATLSALDRVLRRGGDGEVSLTVMLSDGGEVDLRLKGRFDLAGEHMAQLSTIPGVLDIKPY